MKDQGECETADQCTCDKFDLKDMSAKDQEEQKEKLMHINAEHCKDPLDTSCKREVTT